MEEAQTEAEEVENYAAPSILDPNLNGAFADAIPLNHLFARPSHIFTLAPNVATLGSRLPIKLYDAFKFEFIAI